MVKFFGKLKALSFGKKLLIGCYTAFFVLSILSGLFRFCEDRFLRMTGTLQETVYTVEDFEWIALERVQGERNMLISQNTDPRMIMINAPERVRRVDIYISFATKPGEFNIFYMPNAGMEEFDPNYRVWARQESDDHYSFTLPRGTKYGLRLDPGIYGGNEMEFFQIIFDKKMPFFSFFAISYTWIFYFVLVPAMAASTIKYVLEWVPIFKNMKRDRSTK